MRQKWRDKVHEAGKDGMRWAVASSSSRMIDARGLTHSIKKALCEAIGKLGVDPQHCMVLLDGGLYAPKKYDEQRTIIKGDEKEPAIALASIIAKVHRDHVMDRWSLVYPDHDFHIHKGYGTKAHYQSIKKSGLTPIHRRSFLRSIGVR